GLNAVGIFGSNRGFDLFRPHDAAVSHDPVELHTGERTGGALFVPYDVRLTLGDDLLTRLGLNPDGQLIGHGTRRHKQGGLLAQQACRHVLEPVDRGIFSIHIVADFSLRHGLAHGFSRLGHGIAAQVNDTHTGPYNNQPRDKSPRLVHQEKFSLAQRHQPRQDAAPMPTLRPMVQSLTGAESGEVRPLCWSFLYFFCLLCGYYILRPVRDEMAIEGGVQHLPWMMTATFLTMLGATPLFGYVSARVSRERLLLMVYAFFASHLVGFFLVLSGHVAPEWDGRVFFVWLSGFNLFAVSVFWSCMADVCRPEQGVRLFSVIAAGGSTGGILAPLMTTGLTYLVPIPGLMLVSAALLGMCWFCIRALDRWAKQKPGPVAESVPG